MIISEKLLTGINGNSSAARGFVLVNAHNKKVKVKQINLPGYTKDTAMSWFIGDSAMQMRSFKIELVQIYNAYISVAINGVEIKVTWEDDIKSNFYGCDFVIDFMGKYTTLEMAKAQTLGGLFLFLNYPSKDVPIMINQANESIFQKGNPQMQVFQLPRPDFCVAAPVLKALQDQVPQLKIISYQYISPLTPNSSLTDEYSELTKLSKKQCRGMFNNMIQEMDVEITKQLIEITGLKVPLMCSSTYVRADTVGVLVFYGILTQYVGFQDIIARVKEQVWPLIQGAFMNFTSQDYGLKLLAPALVEDNHVPHSTPDGAGEVPEPEKDPYHGYNHYIVLFSDVHVSLAMTIGNLFEHIVKVMNKDSLEDAGAGAETGAEADQKVGE